MAAKKSENRQDSHSAPLASLEYGICLPLAAPIIFLILHVIENSSEGGPVHWLIALLYQLGGKWFASGAVALLGIGVTVAAGRNRRKVQEPEARQQGKPKGKKP
jgi:hypothetical protein